MAESNLNKGDSGLKVRVLQRRLKGREGVKLDKKLNPIKDKNGDHKGWKIELKVDGQYGPATERAVKSFEYMHGIHPDGTAGKQVLRKLNVGKALRRARKRSADRGKIYSRERWGAKPPHAGIGGVVEPTSMHFLHCTVAHEPGPKATIAEECAEMRNLQNIAFGRGFSDISYSFVVFQSGRVYEGRGWDRAGAHTEGYNSITYATAAAIGCTGQAKVTDALLSGMASVIRQGIKNGSIKKDVTVRGHREVAPKSCPGQYIYDNRGKIKRLAT